MIEMLKAPFTEVIDFQEGPGILAKDFRETGVPLVRLSGLDSGVSVLAGCNFLAHEMVKRKWAHFALAEGDILLSTSASLGRVVTVTSEGVGAIAYTGIMRMRPRDKRVFAPFIRYLLASPEFQQQARAAGAGSILKHFGPMHLNYMHVHLPIVQEQEKIAAVLSDLDAKIDLNNRINAELEAMAKTLYDYWFVQFDFPDANGKPYKSSGGKMVYNATLKREIPAEWSDAVVADILDKSPSSTKILNKDIHDSGAIPVIDQSQRYICGFTDERTSLIVPKQAHVVFGDHTRAVKLVNFSYARGADGTQILVSKDIRMPGYLMYQVVSDIDLSSYGYARHFKFLKESKILLPDKDIAQKYELSVTPIFEKSSAAIFENMELARLRDWLLPMLMNGQVTVADT